METEAVLEAGDVEGVVSTLENFDATRPLLGASRSATKKTPRAKTPEGRTPETPAPAELTEEEKLHIATQEELEATLKLFKGFYDTNEARSVHGQGCG